MPDARNVIERAVELAGGVDALASVLSIPAMRVQRWLEGSESLPRYATEHLSRRIAQAEKAAARVLQRVHALRAQPRP
jgi:hypothetical protein